MSDLIDRQAVLNGIAELKRSPWCTDKRGNGFEYLITEALDVVSDLCIKQEPSVDAIPKSVIEDIKAEIESQLFVGRILNSKDFDDGLKWCLDIIDKHISGKENE